MKNVKLVKKRYPLAAYQQLASSIVEGIADGTIQENDVLPSINQLSAYFDVSRNTVERAYSYLKKMDTSMPHQVRRIMYAILLLCQIKSRQIQYELSSLF